MINGDLQPDDEMREFKKRCIRDANTVVEVMTARAEAAEETANAVSAKLKIAMGAIGAMCKAAGYSGAVTDIARDAKARIEEMNG